MRKAWRTRRISPEARRAAADHVAAYMAEADEEFAKRWRTKADQAISQGKKIPVDQDIYEWLGEAPKGATSRRTKRSHSKPAQRVRPHHQETGRAGNSSARAGAPWQPRRFPEDLRTPPLLPLPAQFRNLEKPAAQRSLWLRCQKRPGISQPLETPATVEKPEPRGPANK